MNTKKNSTRTTHARTSVHHAQDIALLSPSAAGRRLWNLRGASPVSFAAAMNRFAVEKAFAFSSACWAASFAALSSQLRWVRSVSAGRQFEPAQELENFSRKALKPVAARVRRNSAARN